MNERYKYDEKDNRYQMGDEKKMKIELTLGLKRL